MDAFLPIVVIVVLVLLGWVVITYNRLVVGRNRVDNSWGQVDVQLGRRNDLVPNLVETVKGYASHEQETLDRVIQARNRAQAATGPAEAAEAENLLTGALRQLFALAEAYPDLKASDGFRDLQAQLTETEDKIAVARQIYNDTVLTFNNRVQTVPSNLVASMTGFETRPYFDAPAGAAEPPQVQF